MAGEVCVSCAGPDAVYRCQAEGFGPEDTRAQVACITELARLEGHRSCGVDRRPAGPCDGPLKIVERNRVPEFSPPELGVPGANLLPKNEAASPARPPERPPTVARELKKAGEAAEEQARTAGEQIGGAGKAVGAAAQKTWNCVTSLMQDC